MPTPWPLQGLAHPKTNDAGKRRLHFQAGVASALGAAAGGRHALTSRAVCSLGHGNGAGPCIVDHAFVANRKRDRQVAGFLAEKREHRSNTLQRPSLFVGG